MFHSKMILSTAICTALALVSIGFMPSTGAGANDPASPWTAQIRSANKEDWNSAVQLAISQRDDAAKALVPILRQPFSEERRPQIAAAMKISGSLRLTEAVAPLIDKIDVQEFRIMPATRPARTEDDFLAVKALIDIGDPAIDPALRGLATETNLRRQMLLAVVVKDVIGRDCARPRHLR